MAVFAQFKTIPSMAIELAAYVFLLYMYNSIYKPQFSHYINRTLSNLTPSKFATHKDWSSHIMALQFDLQFMMQLVNDNDQRTFRHIYDIDQEYAATRRDLGGIRGDIGQILTGLHHLSRIGVEERQMIRDVKHDLEHRMERLESEHAYFTKRMWLLLQDVDRSLDISLGRRVSPSQRRLAEAVRDGMRRIYNRYSAKWERMEDSTREHTD